MTPDARVLRFPSGAGGMAEEEYGRFSRELSPDELAGCFFFSDDDRRRIASRWRDTNRLGFAVQLGTVPAIARSSSYLIARIPHPDVVVAVARGA